MEYKTLGKTGLKVSRMGFGGIPIQKIDEEGTRKLLRDTTVATAEIAAAVGYKDSHYFSFVFKKTQGVSPRDYRNGKKN